MAVTRQCMGLTIEPTVEVRHKQNKRSLKLLLDVSFAIASLGFRTIRNSSGRFDYYSSWRVRMHSDIDAACREDSGTIVNSWQLMLDLLPLCLKMCVFPERTISVAFPPPWCTVSYCSWCLVLESWRFNLPVLMMIHIVAGCTMFYFQSFFQVLDVFVK